MLFFYESSDFYKIQSLVYTIIVNSLERPYTLDYLAVVEITPSRWVYCHASF